VPTLDTHSIISPRETFPQARSNQRRDRWTGTRTELQLAQTALVSEIQKGTLTPSSRCFAYIFWKIIVMGWFVGIWHISAICQKTVIINTQIDCVYSKRWISREVISLHSAQLTQLYWAGQPETQSSNVLQCHPTYNLSGRQRNDLWILFKIFFMHKEFHWYLWWQLQFSWLVHSTALWYSDQLPTGTHFLGHLKCRWACITQVF
jgi:hypothetical protein